jgi:hypothetical protein
VAKAPEVGKVEKFEDNWEKLVYNHNESMKDVLRFRQLRSYIDKKYQKSYNKERRYLYHSITVEMLQL